MAGSELRVPVPAHSVLSALPTIPHTAQVFAKTVQTLTGGNRGDNEGNQTEPRRAVGAVKQ